MMLITILLMVGDRCSIILQNMHAMYINHLLYVMKTGARQTRSFTLMFRNISMHAFARLFATDLNANDCRVFDWLGALRGLFKIINIYVFVQSVLLESTCIATDNACKLVINLIFNTIIYRIYIRYGYL